jgi:hypothetical protein
MRSENEGLKKNMKILCELIQFHATIVFVLLTFLSSSQSENEIAIHIPFVSLLVFNGWNKYYSTATTTIATTTPSSQCISKVAS